MNIERIVRGNFIVKMGLSSTGYFNVLFGKETKECHAVSGDELDVELRVIWGRNKITLEAVDELHVDFMELLSDLAVKDWEGNQLTTICKNKKIVKGEKVDLFFTYPVALSEEFIKLKKDDMLYYE
jgi:hypothetical protein